MVFAATYALVIIWLRLKLFGNMWQHYSSNYKAPNSGEFGVVDRSALHIDLNVMD
jgi:hypothetical protein